MLSYGGRSSAAATSAAPQRRACPAEVGVARGRRCLRGGAAARSASPHSPMSVIRRCAIRAERVGLDGGRRLLGPPDDDRRVRQQQRHDQGVDLRRAAGPRGRRTMTSLAPASAPTRISASSPVARRPSPGATTITRHGCSVLAWFAAWIAVSIVGAVGDDDQGQHAAERDGPALVAQLDQPARDRAGRRVLDLDLHGRRQVRPSRASISSADAGPQRAGTVAARACRGSAQYVE